VFFKLKERHLKRLLIATSLGLLTSLCVMHAQATTNQKKPTVQKSKPVVVKTHVRRQMVKAVPAVPSFGQKAGLHATNDILDLKSSVAYVIDKTPMKSCSARTTKPFYPLPLLPS
jgi:D-alanyl-D-alanine endopeptidase (penicillin-binding protein 7)